MKSSPTDAVAPEEVARRVAEYRRISYERKLPAQAVYAPDKAQCPWPACEMVIAGIRFDLEKMGNSSRVAGWLDSWWNGPGLVGRCPRCAHYVLFEVTGKQKVSDPRELGGAVLPEDWSRWAHFVRKSE
jgi:hypothetical protein